MKWSCNNIYLERTSTFSFFRSCQSKYWSCQNRIIILIRWRCYWHVFFLIHTDNRRTNWIIMVDRWALQMRKRGRWEKKSHPCSCLTMSCNLGHKRVLHATVFFLPNEVISFNWLVFFLVYHWNKLNENHPFSLVSLSHTFTLTACISVQLATSVFTRMVIHCLNTDRW